MIDLKLLREDPDAVRRSQVSRGEDPALVDALLAAAVMSLQAVKAVEIGSGITAAASLGSAVHDEIGYSESNGFAGFTRTRNNAGGIEGGGGAD